jgi:hypothetical protein
MLNETFSLRDQGLSTSVDGASRARHRWYHVKESFSPALLETAIKETRCEPGDLVVDPFCGSGTAPLVAVQTGLNATGFEVNPFLAFVSRAKLAHVTNHVLTNARGRALGGINSDAGSNLSGFSTFTYRPGLEKWLFNRGVLSAFEGAWIGTKAMSPPLRSVVRLALIGSAMDCCNAVRDGKCLRYRPEWRKLGFNRDTFIEAFEARFNDIENDLATAYTMGNGRVFLGDSRKLIGTLDGQFRLCVTSPPYLNSFDYSDIYRPEMFLGRFVTSMEQLRSIRLRTVRSHVQASWQVPDKALPSLLATKCIANIKKRKDDLWDHRIPIMVHAYFEDMQAVLTQLRAKALESASVWMVVSTSAYVGIEIPVDLILAELGVSAGWYLREVGVLRYLRSSGQHWSKAGTPTPPLRESVVILDAKAQKRTPKRSVSSSTKLRSDSYIL